MYEVKDWNEEVMKWLAVGLCLAMVGLAVMPMAVGELWGGLSLMAPNKTAGAIILAGAAWHTAVWTAALAMAGASVGVSVAAAVALTL